MKNVKESFFAKAIEKIAKISAGTVSHFELYQPKTPKALQKADVKTQKEAK